MSIENATNGKQSHDHPSDMPGAQTPSLEVLTERFIINGKVYRQHPRGGGFVAFDAYVPDELYVYSDVFVHSGTRLVTDALVASSKGISGDHISDLVTSRVMNENDWNDYFEQRERRGLPTFEEDEELSSEQSPTNDILPSGY